MSLREECKRKYAKEFNRIVKQRDLLIDKLGKDFDEKFKGTFDDTEYAKKKGEFIHSDLSVVDLQRGVEELYEKLHSRGYFRSSFNVSGLLGTLNFQVLNYVDNLGFISVKDAKAILELATPENQVLPSLEELRASHARIEDEGDHSLEGWHSFFLQSLEEFRKFLQDAVDLNEPIRCSY